MIPNAITVLCFAGAPVASVPADGATDVPLDAQPMVLLEPCGYAQSTWYTLTLSDSAGTVLATTQVETTGTGFIAIEPDELLPANTVIDVNIAGDYDVATLYRFTTGDALGESFDGAPTGTLVTERYRKGTSLNYVVDVAPAGDPDGTSVVEVSHAHVGQALVADRDALQFSFDAGRKDERCVNVLQRALNGQSASAEVCEEAGCNTGRAPAGALVALIAALGCRRRRC